MSGSRTRGPRRSAWTSRAAALAMGAAATAPLALPSAASAQLTATVTVEEPAGIRRTFYPASARLEVPEGRLEFVSQIRLLEGSDEIASQGTAWSRWADGSIRDLEVDFNISIGPHENRVLELRYGADVTATVPSGRGLSVTEDDRTLEVGSLQLNKGGATLIASVGYREELIGVGRNGLSIVERSGIRRDPREIAWESVEVLKPGPVAVHARYTGSIRLSGGSAANVTLDLEMPNSKSWLRLSVAMSDPDGKVGELGFETPFRMGAYPWTWDLSTPNGTYGAFRDPTGSAIFTRSVGSGAQDGWRVVAGPAGAEEPYEESPDGQGPDGGTWAHLVGPDEAVALVVREGTGAAGTIMMWLTGTGQTRVGFQPAEPTTEHAVELVQHYVATPVPIGAATSPASILAPLRVTVE